MRPILFRGKTLAGEWIYGDLIQRQYATKIGCYVNMAPTWQDPCGDTVYHEYEVIGETVGQFTDWLDKNGNNIFEGDKLRGMMGEQESENRSPITSTVIFKPGGFEVFTKPMSRCILGRFTWCDSGYHGRRDVYRVIEDLEVVGNIHDKVNPASGESGVNHMLHDPNQQQQEAAEATNDQVAATEQEAQEKALESEETEG
jgi:hypothetical protein